jgi:hypothetical protein
LSYDHPCGPNESNHPQEEISRSNHQICSCSLLTYSVSTKNIETIWINGVEMKTEMHSGEQAMAITAKKSANIGEKTSENP